MRCQTRDFLKGESGVVIANPDNPYFYRLLMPFPAVVASHLCVSNIESLMILKKKIVCLILRAYSLIGESQSGKAAATSHRAGLS